MIPLSVTIRAENLFAAVPAMSALNFASLPEPQSFAIVAARLDGLAPLAVRDVPLDGLAETVLEGSHGRPSELAADPAVVDRVTAIVPRAIGHERLERAITHAGWLHLIENVADAIDNFK